MIDRIEHLRASTALNPADAAEAKIRLVPDALGTIDVSIRHDGDAISVRFQADHAGTRALLQQSEARLVEIAESRGLRLSGSGVDAGGADPGQQRAPQQRQPTLPTAPPRAITSDTANLDEMDAGRVA